MFERFTDRARRVVLQAQAEARNRDHDYIGTEHILLALVAEGIGGVGVKALESMQISADAIRHQVNDIIGRGSTPPQSGHIPFTPRSKKVLELALREALQLGHHYIGTEHVLLGLLREGGGVAAQVLISLGADLDRARQQVTQILTGRHPARARTTVAATPAAAEDLMDRLTSMAARLAVIERKLRDAAAGSG
jgi:ATP-dependent Clp protease ATP-binding subunit ClpC